MSWFNSLVGLFSGSTTEKLLDIALERTEDVDKRHALIMSYLEMREQTRRAELARVTVPWVDAVHKMGRQIFWGAFAVGVFVLIAMGKGDELARYSEFIFTAAAGGGAYTLLKGRGQ